jgi:hypothetical protein
MRELKIGDQAVRVRATPLALLFYKQEFHSDLLGDLTKLTKLLKKGAKPDQEIDEDSVDPTQLDSVAILQLIWAMAKADAYGKPFPSFLEWLSNLDSFDLSDPAVLRDALEEAAHGFFRSGVKQGARKAR